MDATEKPESGTTAGRPGFWLRLPLSALAGGAYSLAYPPFFGGGIPGSLTGLFLVAGSITCLLWLLEGQQGTRARTLGFVFGMAAFLSGLTWLHVIFDMLFVVLCAVLAAFFGLFAEFHSRLCRKQVARGWWIVLTMLNWGGWEFIRSELFPLRFPWMTAGLAVGPNYLLPWIGVYGVGMLVVLAAACWKRQMRRTSLGFMAGIAAAVFLLPHYESPSADSPGAIKVGGLQLEAEPLPTLIKRTREMPSDIDYAVWPEYSVPYDIRKQTSAWQKITDLCKERNITLTFGTQAEPDGKPWRNIALTLDQQQVRGEHTKVHTVHYFDDGDPGSRSEPIETNHGKIGTPICFDCDYEGVTRRMTAAGAEAFIIPVMDAESWTARQHVQHAELFRIRACENARWMFVCASSGISQIIDPAGRVHARLGAMEQGPLIGVITRSDRKTFYTRAGWLVPWCALAAAAASWLWLMVFRANDRTSRRATSARTKCSSEA